MQFALCVLGNGQGEQSEVEEGTELHSQMLW